MNKQQIEALPNDPATLKREIVRLHEIVKSHELAKAQRAKEEAIAQSSPAAGFEIDAFTVKASLEGLADGSEDFTDPLERGRICRGAIDLINRMFAALPKA